MNLPGESSPSAAVRQPARRGGGRPDTRAELVRVGTEILTEKGFNSTGIDEVLKRVGVPKGSFYHYFASKEAFGEAVIASYAEYFAAKLDRLLGNPQRAPLDRIRDFIEEAKHGMGKYDFRRGCLVGNLGQELAGLNESFRERLEAVLMTWQARLAACLEEARVRGDIAADADPAAIAEFFWTGWEGAILRAKLTRSLAPMERFAQVLFDCVLR